MDKRIHIAFPYIHLAYSPTVLKIASLFKDKGYSVFIITLEPDVTFSSKTINDYNIYYLPKQRPKHNFFSRLLNKVSFIYKRDDDNELLYSPDVWWMVNYFQSIEISDLVIAVDFKALWCVQKAGISPHFLSTEIFDNDIFRDKITKNKIKSILIQSRERLQYLFGNDVENKIFYIPNSPVFKPLKQKKIEFSYNFVYCGSAALEFGIIAIFDFLVDYPKSTLTLIGALPLNTKEVLEGDYHFLVTEKRLIIDENYYDESDLPKLLSNFDIGFCFYDYQRYPVVRKFNYMTAPSGKLYQYFNAGIPVITNYIPAFEFLESRNAGIRVKFMTANSIYTAIEYLKNNYEEYSNNSKLLSREFDFNDAIMPFWEYVNRY